MTALVRRPIAPVVALPKNGPALDAITTRHSGPAVAAMFEALKNPKGRDPERRPPPAVEVHVVKLRRLRDKRCAATTPDDLRRVVARLNAKAEGGEVEASTARRIWSQCRCMFRQTFDHELDELRVRKDDPTSGVRSPRKGSEKQKAILYPDEALVLMSHPDVPLRGRRLWALLIYTGMRVSELRALDWASVDLVHRRIDVHQSIDQRADDEDKDDTKETKTGETREIDILEPLLPLLEAMREEADGAGRVCPFFYERPAGMLQTHLRTAGLSRAALLKSDKSHRALRAQDLRATCATWLGLAEQLDDGGRSIVGQRVSGSYVRDHLGHADYETTENHYLRGKGLRVDAVGAPFPALPGTLLGTENPEPAGGIPARNTCEPDPTGWRPPEIAPDPLRCRSRDETRTGAGAGGSG
ncbi:MAG TPA: site-specific integrase [Polyangiaceae bacterium]|nr:site-specific integrase [Polyangiaceae bacterium]